MEACSGDGSRPAIRSVSSGSASIRIRWRRRTRSRKTFVVIRCSQPSKDPGWKVSSERKTRMKVSWVMSSASWALPDSR